MKEFFVALAVLALVHTLVSFAAYRFLTKRTVEFSTDYPPVETAPPEQQARGVTTITLRHTEVMSRVVPTPVVLYMWFGYAGLAAAVLYLLYFRIRHGQ
jgi:hypothetical protein